MLQTEFCGSGCKLVISWDTSSNANDLCADNIQSDDLIQKVNQLYETISKFSAEFVGCMRQMQNTSQGEGIPENLNLSFKIGSPSAIESSHEITKLQKEIEKLRNENIQLEIDLKNKDADISELRNEREQNVRELRNKYQKEMNELRIYFEKFCHENYERKNLGRLLNTKSRVYENLIFRDQIIEKYSYSYSDVVNDVHNHKNKPESNLNSNNDVMNQDYQLNPISFDDVDTENKFKSRETPSFDLKMFIMKAYNMQIQKFKDNLGRRKDEEIEKLKKDNEKYSQTIEILQVEIDNLMYDKALENKVKEIHRQVREDYETDLESQQDISDNEFLLKMKNDKETLEKELKRKFENALNELNYEWEKKVEVLSELLVKSSIRSVEYEETIEKVEKEKERCLNEIDRCKEELRSLKMPLIECMKMFSYDEGDENFERIGEELLNMKKHHEYEVTKLQEKIRDLQQRIASFNNSREEIITNLTEEVTDLISKEQHGECVTWPSELSVLEQVFAKRFETSSQTSRKLMRSDSLERETGVQESCNISWDLNQVLEERDGLRKVNLALKGVINMFTRYLTNCEEERNHTLIEALVNAEKLNRNTSISGFGTSVSDMDMTLAEGSNLKKLKFSSNASEITNLLEEFNHSNMSCDASISVDENDLKSWLHILRGEASTVLKLISNQKYDTDFKLNRNEGVQTVVTAEQLRKDEEKIRVLQDCLQKAENELITLTREMTYLKENIKPNESIEAYGEASNSVVLTTVTAPQNMVVLESEALCDSDVIFESEEYCIKCDKVKDEARKEIEDLQLQMEAVKNKLEKERKFIEQQAVERDSEREEFEKELRTTKDCMKDRERDIYFSTKEKFKNEVTHLEQQIKYLDNALEECIESKKDLETRFRTSEKKLKTFRDDNSELEKKLAQKCELAARLEMKLKNKETELKNHESEYQNLLQQLEKWSEVGIKQYEEFSDTHVTGSNIIDKMKNELTEIEKLVNLRTRELEYLYSPIVVNSVVSSLSEDVSVCDVMSEQTRSFSPSMSDTSLSSPGRINSSINLLSCLHEKLKKLFRAEEAAFKKIREHDKEVAKLNDSIRKLELERDTLNESLRTATSKLSQTKIELENWQHGHHSYQSDIQLTLVEKIHKLESIIAHYKKYLSQKDYYDDSKLVRAIMSLQAYVSSSDHDAKHEAEEIMNQLKTEFEEFKQEKIRLQVLFSGLDDDSVDEISTPKRRKLLHVHKTRNSTPEAASKLQLKRNHVSFADNLESYSDSDVSRRAVAVEGSPLAKFGSLIRSSEEAPLINISENSSFNQRALKVRKKFDVERISVSQPKDSENNHSIDINVNALSSLKYQPDNQESCSFVDETSASESNGTLSEVKTLNNELNQEKHNHQLTISKLCFLQNEKKTWKEQETEWEKQKVELLVQKQKLQDDLKNLQSELHFSKEKCHTLTEELKTSTATIEHLKQKCEEFERKAENEIEVDKNEYRKSEEFCKLVVKGRIGAEMKCEQYSKSVQQLSDELHAEKDKSKALSESLEKANSDCAQLQELTKDLQNTIDGITKVLEFEKERFNALSELNKELECDTRDGMSTSNDRSSIGRRTDSLRNLTEKVQKEVEVAAELDKHMYENLESTSESSLLLNDLLWISSTMSSDAKRVFFKILREGCENLTTEEKKILAESLNLVDMKSNELQMMNTQLTSEIESKKVVIKDLMSKESWLRSENARLETVLSYYDERISFLVSKLDEYRNRYVKNEIELTARRCTHSQLEVQMAALKKECDELRIQADKQAESLVDERNVIIKENLELKQKIDTLKNHVEALTAELNSIKVLTQYHSESETELSKSLNPLKLRLNEVQEKYARLRAEYEKKKIELQTTKSNLKIERNSNQKLDDRFKIILQEKRDLEEKLIELKMNYDDLTWQKQNVDDKLKAAELAEMKRRKLLADKNTLTRRETESSKEAQRQLEEEHNKLQQNLFKIKEEFSSLRYSWKEICEETQRLFHRMLVAEKNQRSLVYQKNYFISIGIAYEINTIIKNCSNESCLVNVNEIYFNRTTNRPLTVKQKFKSFTLVIISIRRMKFLITRRVAHSRQIMVEHFATKLPNVKIYPWCDFVLDSAADNVNSGARLGSDVRAKNNEYPLVDDSLKVLYLQYKRLQETYESA